MSLPDKTGLTASQGLDPNEWSEETFSDADTPRVSLTSSGWDAARTIVKTLDAGSPVLGSFGVTEQDRTNLIAHLGRKTLQGSPTREFKKAWRKDKDGNTVPKLYRVETDAMRRCQYVVLAHKQRSAVIIIDIDQYGHRGGDVEHIHQEVYNKLALLALGNLGPAWIGVNPTNGKCQLIWLIDPVYADYRADSSNIRLMKLVTTMLGDYLGGDAAFAHRLSRSPFYTGDDPTAYRWHVQHHRIDQLSHLRDEVRTMTGHHAPQQSQKPEQAFSSGRELIEAVVARREQATQAREILASLDGDLPNAEALDGDRIDGVKVLWITETRAARDETAFRHALATAHQLREAGKKMTDAAIIDAYERAYTIAQAVGADHREPEMPPMRDRLTMARRVRGYVLGHKKNTGSSSFAGSAGHATARERKALATMGRRGGQKAAQRWNDRDSDYVKAETAKLKQANAKRAMSGRVTARQIANYFDDTMLQTGSYPSISEAMQEFSVSRPTVNRALKKAGISLPRGRRTASK